METSIYSCLLMLTGVVALLLHESFSNNSCYITGLLRESLVELNSTFRFPIRQCTASETVDWFTHALFDLSSKRGGFFAPPTTPSMC